MTRLAIDFGTSNTAAALMAGNRPTVLPMEPGAETLPTAVFMDFSRKRFVYGNAALTALRDGAEGRFLRALKSVLGTPLAQENRTFLNERMTLIEVIARFLDEIRLRSEAFTGMRFDAVLSGRPVRFHSADAGRDAQAEADLRAAYALAGFRDVDFLPEPEAAALAVGGTGRMLIVDIGGGTSDFTLCDRANGQTQVLASRGLRLGGTDFDRTLSLAHAMPLFGYDAPIRAQIGTARHPAPRAPFQDLATWEKIPFVYDAGLLREVRRWVRLSDDPRLFERLAEVLEAHLGHDVAHAVEAAKIAANDTGTGQIALHLVERGLTAALPRAALETALAAAAEAIGAEAMATLADAGAAPASVDVVVFVGGSSLLAAIRAELARRLPDARQEVSEVFTAVAHGLAIAAT
jgi:hypothetical chaperone protein